jgi:hypothetical protein
MGPCCYCKKMIYLDWIAERGYHRSCHEKYLAGRKFAAFEAEVARNRVARAEREHEKRRERKRLKRIAEKAAR